MKTYFLIGVFVISSVANVFSQVSINSDGGSPDPSAMLDVQSSVHGILIPRITSANRDLIPSPASGLLIYNTTTSHLDFYNGTYWFQIQSALVSSATGTTSANGGVSVKNLPDEPAVNSALLDVAASDKGVLIPRTTPGSVIAPATGLIIFNTLTNLFNYYNGGNWSEIIAISTSQPGALGSQTPAGMAIKPDGTDPHPSAMLDVAADNMGLLIPRLTSSQRDELSPATALIIYNSSTKAIEFFDGTGWNRVNVQFSCGSPLLDPRDGQAYNTVQIGTQCWMAESLNYGSMTANNAQMSNNGTAEKYCYDNDEMKCQEWGALYQWDEAMQYSLVESTQGICPDLWHVPSEAEWDVLDDFLGGYNVAGGPMKEAGTSHWANPNTGATNSSGFTGIASGYNSYSSATPSSGLWTHNYIWASTEAGSAYARRRALLYFNAKSNPYYDLKWLGFSVRCIKD